LGGGDWCTVLVGEGVGSGSAGGEGGALTTHTQCGEVRNVWLRQALCKLRTALRVCNGASRLRACRLEWNSCSLQAAMTRTRSSRSEATSRDAFLRRMHACSLTAALGERSSNSSQPCGQSVDSETPQGCEQVVGCEIVGCEVVGGASSAPEGARNEAAPGVDLPEGRPLAG